MWNCLNKTFTRLQIVLLMLVISFGSATSYAYGAKEIRVIKLGVGQEKRVSLERKFWRNVRVTSSDSEVAQIDISSKGTSFFVKAKRPGEGTIAIVSGQISRWLKFDIRPVAADFPQKVEAVVAGNPALASTVGAVIEGALKRQLQTSRAATFTYRISNLYPVLSGKTATIPVRVWVRAPETISTDGIVNVKVRNIGLTPMLESSLWFSNDPERILKPGNLFAAVLNPGQSTRLLYHQINESLFPVVTRTLLLNESDVPAKVLIIPGDSPAVVDPVDAGTRAADQFFRAYLAGSGEVVEIPPHCVMPLSLRRLRLKYISSGLCYIRHIGGTEPLLLKSDVISPQDVDPSWSRALMQTQAEKSSYRDPSSASLGTAAPWRELGCPPIQNWEKTSYSFSTEIYPNPFQNLATTYQVGGRFGYIRIGEVPIVSLTHQVPLHGNFGVNYSVNATLENPTNAPAEAEVIFEASAGYSSGIFLLDDRYVIVDRIQPHAEKRLAKIRLNPGETRKMVIQTIPLSGSSYPATLLIRPVR